MIDPIGREVRRQDPDRFLCALFAPAAARPALWLLYALNHELARAGEITREPGLALIRLAWWREVVEGARRAHALAAPLRAAIEAGVLDAGALLRLIEAREAALEAPAGLDDWLARLLAGPGELAVVGGQILGAPGEALGRLRRLGAGYGGAGALRNWAARGGARAGLAPPYGEGVAMARAVAGLRDFLGRPAAAGAALAAALPAVLARRDLRRPGEARRRGLGDRAAVLAAAVRGRA